MGTGFIFRGYGGRGVIVTNHLHRAPKLKSRAQPLLPLWAFVAFSVNFTVTFYCYNSSLMLNTCTHTVLTVQWCFLYIWKILRILGCIFTLVYNVWLIFYFVAGNVFPRDKTFKTKNSENRSEKCSYSREWAQVLSSELSEFFQHILQVNDTG